MISEVTGIRRIRMLYLQLLYRCNFECLHCFHGKRLQHADAFTTDEAVNLLTLMRDEYGTEAVTLLGGEPFVYRDLAQVVRYAKRDLGMQVEICTNGYRIERRLTEIAPDLDLLRVSLEGIGTTNDKIRKFGSYRSALSALEIAQQLGVRAGATMTVTSRNIDEVAVRSPGVGWRPVPARCGAFGRGSSILDIELLNLRAVRDGESQAMRVNRSGMGGYESSCLAPDVRSVGGFLRSPPFEGGRLQYPTFLEAQRLHSSPEWCLVFTIAPAVRRAPARRCSDEQ
ncbi:radical SAM protein [Streptomyces sp. NPDC102283]|uniref:radical SAM protein n=1 Tax=Streptomyces sp. NPDC102283 TaxID=3366155 RepID=UPI003830738A